MAKDSYKYITWEISPLLIQTNKEKKKDKNKTIKERRK